MQMEGQVIQVNLDDIIPNRFQPRIAFDEKGLNELAASIKEHGIIQPLVLRKLGKKYEIIAGERRYKAATMAGLQTVPAVISNIDDNKSAEVALVENIQRRDLTPIEEARSYKNLLDKGYLTQEQLAKKMGLSQSAISNKLRLLNLDNKVQQALLENKISERHARSLLSLTDKEEQKKWLDKIIKERLTVKQLDESLKNEANNEESGGDVPLVNLTPNIDEIKENATDINNNKPKNIANLLVSEDTMTEYSDNLPNQEVNNVSNNTLNNTSSIPQNMEQPSEQNFNPFSNNNISNNSQEVLNDVPPTSTKFFNQLEDEPATMDNLNPFAPDANFKIDQGTIQNNDVEIFDMQNNNPQSSTMDAMQSPVDTLNSGISNVSQQPAVPNMNGMNTASMENSVSNLNQQFNMPNQPMNSMMPEQPMAMNELNPNNKFFQPVNDQPIDNQVINNVVNPAPVNPMDYVDNMNNQVTPEQQREISLGDAINSVRNMVDELNKKGFNVTIDEADLEASYQMNISIMK